MDFLVVFIPLLPFIAAAIIGFGYLFNRIDGVQSERITAVIAKSTITLSCLLAIALLAADLMAMNSGIFIVGQWLSSGSLSIKLNFISTGFSVIVAALFSIILAVITHFSMNYIHSEAGFHRFYFVLSLFSSGMLLLILSGNAAGTFIGWEIAGLCSYLLISFAYDRPVAAINATRVFVTNRIGDAGFILGIALSFYFSGTIDWVRLNEISETLATPTVTVISLAFVIAAIAKSAQLPFTPWLARAMEGPTPSSAVFYGAVMIHSGVFLVILLHPLIEKAPLTMALLVVVGLFTAIYSFIVGLTQTDVKSSVCFAISGQLGLMFLECGLGLWELATWHLCAHAIVRCYQVLTAPSFLFYVHRNPMRLITPYIANKRWLYIASLQRFWLDPIADRTLVRPINGLGHDLDRFDKNIIDRAMGAPVSTNYTISSLTQLEKNLDKKAQHEIQVEFVRGSGMVGKLFEWIANIMSWFEDRLVLRGIGMDMVGIGSKLGQAAITFEQFILKPRYLVLFVFIVLMIAASI
ncbi:MAG: proton-conducting transporter membrane subunit [Nitrosomonas sp.]|uniref:proton-conducting transporter transmembrane domain-containing protein n=1 Tax=Nitrosomonas sp. TaxID=42353 RepID=UPI002722D4F9|nr:proton-conducting transporter membrane subunit [Nitrosomonas sp.]MDO9469161.1 proton-conducting transporter membrane subunit [Nitrosomonas sp.]MDP1787910.1 proton-conducting transporter membrane subunit [Nitrosomonas sp.]MDP2223303.1 proton-conducting transporter membrane subunit [Nitrosomonas sp.]